MFNDRMPEELVWVLDTIRHDVSTYGLIIPKRIRLVASFLPPD